MNVFFTSDQKWKAAVGLVWGSEVVSRLNEALLMWTDCEVVSHLNEADVNGLWSGVTSEWSWCERVVKWCPVWMKPSWCERVVKWCHIWMMLMWRGSLLQEFLDRRKMTEFGSLALVDEGAGDGDGVQLSLPGVRKGERHPQLPTSVLLCLK